MAHYVFAWIPAYAGTTTYLSQWPTPGRPRYRVSQDPRKRDANLRRSGGGRSPGFTRMARHVFAWIPAYAGTTKVLTVARPRRRDFSLRRSGGGRSPGRRAHGAPHLCWIPAYAETTVLEPVGLRRDDKVSSVARSKQTKFQSPSLRRRPEPRLRAHGTPRL